MTPPSPDPEPVAAEPLSAISVEPLSELELDGVRKDLDPDDAYQYGGWAHLVARLLATLDAARSAPPITATEPRLREALEYVRDGLEGLAVKVGAGTDSWGVHGEINHQLARVRSALAALPVREDGPTGIDGRAVHAAWRDGMLGQGRIVSPERMAWETLTDEDRALDDAIADRLTREASHVRDTDRAVEAGLPPGPYRVEWPEEQGGWFKVWGQQGTPPDGWAIPLVAMGMQSPMEWLAAHLNALSGPPRSNTALDVERPFVVRQFEGEPWVPLHKAVRLHEAVLDAAGLTIATLRNDLALAIAHDRQPYPTAWAYEQACAAREEWQRRALEAEARLSSPTPEREQG